MLYLAICRDRPDALPLRLETRPKHLEFLENLKAKGIVKMAGPYLDDDGKPCGTVAVYDLPSKQEAEKLSSADPYSIAGLFETVEIRPYNWVINRPD